MMSVVRPPRILTPERTPEYWTDNAVTLPRRALCPRASNLSVPFLSALYVSALFFVCAALTACSNVGSTTGVSTSVDLITQGGDSKRGRESSAGIAGSADASDSHNSDTMGAKSPENPLFSLLANLSAVDGLTNVSTEPLVGIYPVENQSVNGVLGIVMVAKSGAVSLLSADLRRGKTLFNLSGRPTRGALSPAGDRLAISFGEEVELVSPTTGTVLDRFARIKSRITALDWSPDGAALLLGAADGRVYRWRLDGAAAELGSTEWNRRFERYIGHGATVGAVRYHPHGKVFFSGDWDGALSAWRDYQADAGSAPFEQDVLRGEFFTRQPARQTASGGTTSEGIDAILVDRHARRLVTARQDGTLEVWGIRGLKFIGSRPPAGGAVYAMALSEDGGTLAIGSRDGRVRRFRLGDGSVGTPPFEPIGENVAVGAQHLAFLRNGTLLAADRTGKVVALPR